jgi:hypothetical protein
VTRLPHLLAACAGWVLADALLLSAPGLVPIAGAFALLAALSDQRLVW